MRRLAIDYGSKRIGFALSEADVSMVFPLKTLELSPSLSLETCAQKVAAVIAEHNPDEIILGDPLQLDGQQGHAARKVRAFKTELEKTIQTPIILWDERFSTITAQEMLHAAGKNTKSSRKHIDAAAAMAILQSYLDAKTTTLKY